jgi:hypothetical protein
MPIDVPRDDYRQMLPRWKRMRDLLEGEDAVKAAGTSYLRRLGGQSDEQYSDYRDRALFYPAVARTLRAFLGLAFKKNPMVALLDRARAWLQDLDQQGTPLADLASRLLSEQIGVGRAAVLVDMADESVPVASRRPYLTIYRAEQVINWRTERVADDAYALTMVVLKESAEVPSGDPYTPKYVDQYRVLSLEPGEGGQSVYTVTIHRPNARGQLEAVADPIVPTRRGKPLTFIPFVPLNASSIRVELEKPPLEDLGLVSLSHYKTSADTEWALHFTALPTPWAVGLAQDIKSVPLGPSAFLKLSGPNAQAGLLEFKGAGLEELRLAKTAKEELMASLGGRLLERATGAPETAEAIRSRNAVSHATLRGMTNALSAALTLALRWACWWGATTELVLDPAITCELDSEFMTAMSPEDLRALMLLWQAGGLSFESLYWNLQRAEKVRPDVTAAEEKALLDGEADLRKI